MDDVASLCRTHGGKKNAFTVLLDVPEGKKPLKRPKYRWKDNVKMVHRKIEYSAMDRLHICSSSELQDTCFF
jgi:hypothetical protein